MDRYIGKVLDDRYEIISSIGIGGMAYVYKAKCRRLSRFVAIKILKQEFANDAEFKRRFKNESNAVARLSHKNIVSIFDVSLGEKINYIVMELIEGITLKEYLQKKENLDWKKTVFFGSQIAEALEHAHSRGIIHQDIKPHNIMLLRDGTLKVADFGIAKLENEGETKVIKEAIGSVHYVSPEQAKGNSIDARTDLYSLGVVMYEMITGRTPYKGETAISIVMQHINSMPTPPSTINENMPSSLEYVILKAMNPSLKYRYKSATEVYADIEKIKANPCIVFEKESTVLSVLNETQIIPQDELREAISKSKSQKNEVETNTKKENDTKTVENEEDTVETKRNFGIIFCALIVVLAITFYAVRFMIGEVFENEIEVPEVVTIMSPSILNLFYDDVLNDAKYEEFNIIIKEEIYSNIPAGIILSQNPEPYQEIEAGTTINLTVSKGEKIEIMPNFNDFDYTLAQIELKRLGITNIEIENDYNDDIEAGNVFKTSPVSGTEITENSKVTLYVSAGKEIILTTVPSLKGLTVEQAELNLEIADLVLGEVTSEISTATEGTIISQGVQSGVDVLSGTVINVVIAEAIPAPVITKKAIAIDIPQDLENPDENIVIEVYIDNKLAYASSHAQDEESITIDIEGTGTSEVNIYGNGLIIDQKIVTFN